MQSGSASASRLARKPHGAPQEEGPRSKGARARGEHGLTRQRPNSCQARRPRPRQPQQRLWTPLSPPKSAPKRIPAPRKLAGERGSRSRVSATGPGGPWRRPAATGTRRRRGSPVDERLRLRTGGTSDRGAATRVAWRKSSALPTRPGHCPIPGDPRASRLPQAAARSSRGRPFPQRSGARTGRAARWQPPPRFPRVLTCVVWRRAAAPHRDGDGLGRRPPGCS